MSDADATAGGAQAEAHRAARRRRRLEEVFGTVTEQTTDDLDAGDPQEQSAGRGDTWLREQVPPHHGD